MDRVIPAARVVALAGDFDRSPAYRGLADALRVLITDGRIAVGVRLPSERELTDALGVSRTTVTRAYAELRDLGYLSSRRGSGSVAGLPGTRGHRGDHLLAPRDPDGDAIDLTCAAPAAVPGTITAFETAVTRLPSFLSGTGYYPSGLAELREAIARRYEIRGLPTDPDQIVVTSGALAGLAVAVRALTSAGDRVLVESPTYPNAIAALKHSGARVVGTDLGPDLGRGLETAGWDLDLMRSTVRQVSPRLAYLIPDFHNPTGSLMGTDERRALAAELNRSGTVAIIDESLVELALDDDLRDDLGGSGQMPPPFALAAPDALSIGSTSKAFWGGLRVGWLRVPPRHMAAVVGARLSLDLGGPLLEQLVATELLGREELLTQRRDELRSSRDALVDALAEVLPEWRVNTPRGGLALWCQLPESLSSALTRTAESFDVLLAPGPSFAPEGGLDRFLRIPYTLPVGQLIEAATRLGPAWEQTLARPGSGQCRTPLVA